MIKKLTKEKSNKENSSGVGRCRLKGHLLSQQGNIFILNWNL